MYKQAQSTILGVVILTGLILSVVSISYLWGQPLVEKSMDKNNVNLLIDNLKEINDLIIYTVNSGSNTISKLNLNGDSFLIDEINNRLVIKTEATIPVINTIKEVPINTYELPRVRESLTFNMTGNELVTLTPLTGYYADVKLINRTFGNRVYNISLHNNTETDLYDKICIWQNVLTESDCVQVGETIRIELVTYEIMGILDSGELAFAYGKYIENQGIKGIDVSGIISSRGIDLVNKEDISLYLTYRTLVDSDGRRYKIVLNCFNNCQVSNVNKELVISLDSVSANATDVISYVTLRTQ